MGLRHSTNKENEASCCQLKKHRPLIRRGSPTSGRNHVKTEASLRITQHVALTEGKNTNLVLCPLLIQVVLSLIAAGSKGATHQQMLSFLRSESVDELNQMCSELALGTFADGNGVGGPKLSFVNGVWIDKSIFLKESYKHVVEHVYKAACKQVDFRTKVTEVTQEVNSWVKNNTNGFIKELIPPGSVDGNTRLIFANALYFKGTWKWKFEKSKTIDSNFYFLRGGSVQVPFMTSRADQFISTYSGFKVLRLCYEKGRDNRQFSMYIFLPNAKDGLPALLQKISSQPDFSDGHIPQVLVGVNNLMIPRFKFSFGLEVSKTLKQLGLTLPFTDPDFNEMLESNGGKGLSVSRVFHKAFIEVNEEGTEAAAATASVVVFKSLDYQDKKVDFVADHPFLFFIREDVSAAVLFVGHVMNPNNISD